MQQPLLNSWKMINNLIDDIFPVVTVNIFIIESLGENSIIP